MGLRSMNDHTKWRIVRAAVVILLCAAAGYIYSLNNIQRIDEADISVCAGKTGRDARAQNRVIRSVLLNAGQWQAAPNADKMSLYVILGRIKGKQKDAVIAVRGPNGNYVAYYEKQGGKYRYSGAVGVYADLRGIQIMPLREQGGGLIVVRGGNGGDPLGEESYIRAYAWDQGAFQTVLNIPEKYVAYYNELWDENKPASRSNWIKLSGRSDVMWENSDAPVVHVLLHQSYSLSSSVNQRERPDDADFDLVRSRDVFENYIWSGKWMHFILFEGIDRQDGEPVAVIEDLSGSPFELAGQFGGAGGKYRVKYIDGTTAVVNRDRIIPNIEVKKTRKI